MLMEMIAIRIDQAGGQARARRKKIALRASQAFNLYGIRCNYYLNQLAHAIRGDQHDADEKSTVQVRPQNHGSRENHQRARTQAALFAGPFQRAVEEREKY